MSIHLESKDLVNPQQMEVAVNGPDGATHLILCTGVVEFSPADGNEVFIFCVGPHISRRQFVGAIASGAFCTIQTSNDGKEGAPFRELEARLISMDTEFDDEAHQVRVRTHLASRLTLMRLAMSYHVSILAELGSR